MDKNKFVYFAKLYPMPQCRGPTFWFDIMSGSTMAASLVRADSPTLVRIELQALTIPALETKGVLEISHCLEYYSQGIVVPNTAGEQIVFDTWDLASIDRA